MRFAGTCKSCGQSFTLSEAGLQPLSQGERLLCEKEGLSWALMVKVVCPGCGTASLAQRSELLPVSEQGTARTDGGAPGEIALSPLRDAEPTVAQGKKRCPDCAEEVNVEARVCRYCRYDFESAATLSRAAAIVAGAIATQVVQESEKRIVEARMARIRRAENAKVLVILLVHIGLLAPAGLLLPFVGQQEQRAEPPGLLMVLVLAIYAIFGFLAVRQWRKAKRMEAAFAAEARQEGLRIHCDCGRPIRNYSPFHYALTAIVVPYGYLSLLFRLKKCRDCKRPYGDTLLAAASVVKGPGRPEAAKLPMGRAPRKAAEGDPMRKCGGCGASPPSALTEIRDKTGTRGYLCDPCAREYGHLLLPGSIRNFWMCRACRYRVLAGTKIDATVDEPGSRCPGCGSDVNATLVNLKSDREVGRGIIGEPV